MQQTQSFQLLNAVVANGSGATPKIGTQDSFAFFASATGGTVGATVNWEVLSPDGQWHRAGQAVLVAAGPAPVLTLSGMPCNGVRATVSGYTNGAITAWVTVGSYSRD